MEALSSRARGLPSAILYAGLISLVTTSVVAAVTSVTQPADSAQLQGADVASRVSSTWLVAWFTVLLARPVVKAVVGRIFIQRRTIRAPAPELTPRCATCRMAQSHHSATRPRRRYGRRRNDWISRGHP